MSKINISQVLATGVVTIAALMTSVIVLMANFFAEEADNANDYHQGYEANNNNHYYETAYEDFDLHDHLEHLRLSYSEYLRSSGSSIIDMSGDSSMIACRGIVAVISAGDFTSVEEEAEAMLAFLQERGPVQAAELPRFVLEQIGGENNFAEPTGEPVWVHHLVPKADLSDFREANSDLRFRTNQLYAGYTTHESISSLVDNSLMHVFELLFVD